MQRAVIEYVEHYYAARGRDLIPCVGIASGRHRHLSLHRRRGLDAAARLTRRRRYAEALAEHRAVLRSAFTGNGGVEVDTQGDAFFVAFPTAPGAIAAAAAATEGLAGGPIRVRIGVHSGTPLVTAEGYVGVDVHRAARIAACGHGGQTLVSAATAGLVGGAGCATSASTG